MELTLIAIWARLGFYSVFIVIGVWAFLLNQSIKVNKASLKPLLFCFAVAALTWIGTPKGFRVLSDDSNLLGMSKSMLESRNVLNPTIGRNYYGSFQPILQELEKRPPVFAALTTVLHFIFGYAVENAFILNGIILFLLLYSAYCVVQQLFNSKAAVLAVLMIAAQPIVVATATGGGYDLWAAYLFFMCAVLAFNTRNSGKDTDVLAFLSTCLVFCWSRYESIAYCLFFVAIARKQIWAQVKVSEAVRTWCGIFVILMLPLGLQQWLARGSHEDTPTQPLFSFSNFTDNAIDFYRVMTNQIGANGHYPFIVPLLWIGIVTVIVLIAKKKVNLWLLALSLFWIALNFSHLGSLFSHPASSRFFLVPVIALTVITVVWLESQLTIGWLILVMTPLFISGVADSRLTRQTNALTLIRETNQVLEYLKPYRNKEVMVIAERPGQYTVMGYGAADFRWATQNKEVLTFDLKRHLTKKVFVVQRREQKSEMLFPEFELPSFKTKQVLEIETASDERTVVSEIQL